ncbi:MAG TPA: sensor domain-containing diguanylate cyclase [Thermoleophilia bacterium]|nr:sensor domain-containing diguanylate cyclase [Thermoleophilia bacterium]
MKRWITAAVLACAAVVAAGQLVVPEAVHEVLSLLLLALVITTVIWQHRTQRATILSLEVAHREQIESERRYRALFDACSDALFVQSHPDDEPVPVFSEVNEAACMALGYSRPELLSMPAEGVIAPEAKGTTLQSWHALREAGQLVFETTLLARDGERLPVEMSARQIEIHGHPVCLAIARNIALRKEHEERLLGISHHDDLTGLLNRRGFFAMVDQTRPRARRLSAQVLLMYFDVDGLKHVNDGLGHAAGDALVVAAADALRLTFRHDDILARLGGDEFVALALLTWDDERLDHQTILTRLHDAVAAKRAELGDDYEFSLSFGTASATWQELGRIDELLARADARMYEAKRARPRPLSKAAATDSILTGHG